MPLQTEVVVKVGLHRPADPEVGELVDKIYPGERKKLPPIGTICEVFNYETGSAAWAKVLLRNSQLHTYTIIIIDEKETGWYDT